VGLGEAPPRGSAAELFSFGCQLAAELRGLVLTGVCLPARYERVLRLAFAARPGDPPARFLLYECMSRYSNLLLLGPDDTVLAAAHQVGRHSAPACS
jgi:predicted ribosome quality control (RQC) complex YloA/Tae2 family protein